MDGITPLNNAIPQTSINMITVRIAVARSGSIFFTPTFAKMAVSEAKRAESKAYTHHIVFI